MGDDPVAAWASTFASARHNRSCASENASEADLVSAVADANRQAAGAVERIEEIVDRLGLTSWDTEYRVVHALAIAAQALDRDGGVDLCGRFECAFIELDREASAQAVTHRGENLMYGCGREDDGPPPKPFEYCRQHRTSDRAIKLTVRLLLVNDPSEESDGLHRGLGQRLPR
jgi:hypothetical protein